MLDTNCLFLTAGEAIGSSPTTINLIRIGVTGRCDTVKIQYQLNNGSITRSVAGLQIGKRYATWNAYQAPVVLAMNIDDLLIETPDGQRYCDTPPKWVRIKLTVNKGGEASSLVVRSNGPDGLANTADDILDQ